MKKIVALLTLLLMLAVPVAAASDEREDYGLPQQVSEFLDKYGEGAEQLQELTPQGLWEALLRALKEQLQRPLKMFYQLAAVLVLAALAKAMTADWANMQVGRQVDMAVILASFLFACRPLLQLLSEIGEMILECKTFVISFVPVFATVMATCGQPAAGAVYTGFFLSSVVVAATLITGVLLPFMKIYMALNISGGLSSAVDLGGLAVMVSKFIKWGLGLIATVFGAVIGLQSLLAGAADSVALKAGKFLIGSSVPVIGGAVSDAIGTVYAGLKVVKGTAGAAGICAIVVLFAPLLLRCLAYYFSLSLAAAAATVTGNGKASRVFGGFCECLELYISILIFFAVMIILSTALMISLGN